MMLEVESMTHLQSVLTENDGVVVTLTQPRTCVPCRRLKPHLEKAAEQRQDLVFVVVDLDIVPEAISKFELMSVPTVKLFRAGEFEKNLEARTVLPLLSEINS